ncbi:cysteine peptidase family C39 domain-containing protein [Flavobacterium sp. P21]|uniref:cysteine peptidase family C39 domain-containing protein n=1 Tax=Flavobacterium sp. P21 TaxID=3423948 RepID=UPI003D67C02D
MDKVRESYLPNATNKRVWRSFGANVATTELWKNENFNKHGHVGFAWGAKREILDAVPLFDKALIGGGDFIIAHAATGQITHPGIGRIFMDNILINQINLWGADFYKVTEGKIGFVEGDLYHIWHGDIEKRQYAKRNEYNAKTKEIVERDENGLFVTNKPDDAFIENYFKEKEVKKAKKRMSLKISSQEQAKQDNSRIVLFSIKQTLLILLYMNKEFYCLYQYLKKEGFSIDLDEFELQILTHPEYPSLLSVTDALSFFNVENGAFNMGISGIDSLPNRFMTVLQDKNGEKGYHLIEEKNDENHICYSNKNKIRISKKELESRWGGVVILIENPELQAWSVFKKIQVKLWNKRSNGKKAIDNYEVLKDALLISNVLENNLSQSSTIHLGNINASLKIMMVINPFSSACKESYFVLEKILEKHFDKVCLDIRFNFNNNDYGYKKSKKFTSN